MVYNVLYMSFHVIVYVVQNKHSTDTLALHVKLCMVLLVCVHVQWCVCVCMHICACVWAHSLSSPYPDHSQSVHLSLHTMEVIMCMRVSEEGGEMRGGRGWMCRVSFRIREVSRSKLPMGS